MNDRRLGVSAELLRELGKPFGAHEVSWRINRAGTKRDKPNEVWAMAVPYLTTDAIFDRLDRVLGAGCWQTAVDSGPGHVYVGLGILVEGEWVWKWDGTGLMESNDALSQQDAGKGDVTNGVKRAAVQWDIGRSIRAIQEKFVDTFDASSSNGKYFQGKSKKAPAFRWNPPTDMGSNRQLEAPDPSPSKARPSDAPKESMSVEEVDAELDRLQGEVRRFMRKNGLKPYHFEALIQADKELPNTAKELRLPEWQHIAETCVRRQLRWDEAVKVMAKDHPTTPERVELLDELAAAGGGVRRDEAVLIEAAKASGWNDAVEYWIDLLIVREREREKAMPTTR